MSLARGDHASMAPIGHQDAGPTSQVPDPPIVLLECATPRTSRVTPTPSAAGRVDDRPGAAFCVADPGRTRHETGPRRDQRRGGASSILPRTLLATPEAARRSLTAGGP